MEKAIRLLLFRTYRVLRGRDFCEVCPGDTGVRGNEQIVDGVVMCDDCHARHMVRTVDGRREVSVDVQRVVQSLRATIALNRSQPPQVIAKAVLEVADAIERGDLGLLRKANGGVRRA